MNKTALALLWGLAAIAVCVAVAATVEILSPSGALSVWGSLLLLVGAIGAPTARRGRWSLFVVINVVLIAGVSHWMANSGGGGGYSPTNFGLILMAAYIPIHAACMIVVGGTYAYLRRDRSSDEANR